MTLDEAIKYVNDVAKSYGYTHHQLTMLAPDLREMLYQLPNTDKDDLDNFIEELL